MIPLNAALTLQDRPSLHARHSHVVEMLLRILTVFKCDQVHSRQQKDNGLKCRYNADTSSQLVSVDMMSCQKHLPVAQFTNTNSYNSVYAVFLEYHIMLCLFVIALVDQRAFSTLNNQNP